MWWWWWQCCWCGRGITCAFLAVIVLISAYNGEKIQAGCFCTWVSRRARWEISRRRPVVVHLRWTLAVAESRRRQGWSWADTSASRRQRTCRGHPRRCWQRTSSSTGGWRCRPLIATGWTDVGKCWHSDCACCPASWSDTTQPLNDSCL